MHPNVGLRRCPQRGAFADDVLGPGGYARPDSDESAGGVRQTQNYSSLLKKDKSERVELNPSRLVALATKSQESVYPLSLIRCQFRVECEGQLL